MSRPRHFLAPRPALAAVLALAATLAGASLLVTTVQVAALRWHAPEKTAWMRLRERQARDRGQELRLRRTWVPLSEIPRHLRRAVVAAEDGRFWEHHGFDWEAIRKARERNERSGRRRHGGSTITQQLAKNLYLSPARTWLRKGREAVITVFLELLLPKERILELYLNSIELGPGVFGVAEGARHRFGVGLGKLDPWQECVLAALIPAPLRYRVSGAYVQRRAEEICGLVA